MKMNFIWIFLTIVVFGYQTKASDLNGFFKSFPEGIATGVKFNADGKISGGKGWSTQVQANSVNMEKPSPYTDDKGIYRIINLDSGRVLAMIPDRDRTSGKVIVMHRENGEVLSLTKCNWDTDGKVLKTHGCGTINSEICLERLNLPAAKEPKYLAMSVINYIFNENATTEDLIKKLQDQESKNLDTLRINLKGLTISVEQESSISSRWKTLIKTQFLNESRYFLEGVAELCKDMKFPYGKSKTTKNPEEGKATK